MALSVRRLADEQLRRGSARLTQSIAGRFGDRLDMWVGCGYPKSGTVWLCNLLAGYLNLPHPRNYRLPVAMPSIVQAHWLPGRSRPRTIYIVRDGRDVMVSWYFREVKLSSTDRNPLSARRRRGRFRDVLGPGADLDDVRGNLARFIRAELAQPLWMPASWPHHVRAWLDQPPDRLAVVRYEDLLISVVDTLTPALARLDGPVNAGFLRLAEERFDFTSQRRSGGAGGESSPYLRHGVSGDWRAHFTEEAEDIFARAAGDVLARLGYPRTRGDSALGSWPG